MKTWCQATLLKIPTPAQSLNYFSVYICFEGHFLLNPERQEDTQLCRRAENCSTKRHRQQPKRACPPLLKSFLAARNQTGSSRSCPAVKQLRGNWRLTEGLQPHRWCNGLNETGLCLANIPDHPGQWGEPRNLSCTFTLCWCFSWSDNSCKCQVSVRFSALHLRAVSNDPIILNITFRNDPCSDTPRPFNVQLCVPHPNQQPPHEGVTGNKKPPDTRDGCGTVTHWWTNDRKESVFTLTTVLESHLTPSS